MNKECTCELHGPEGLMAKGCTCGHLTKAEDELPFRVSSWKVLPQEIELHLLQQEMYKQQFRLNETWAPIPIFPYDHED